MCVCVCVCVCEGERTNEPSSEQSQGREREGQRGVEVAVARRSSALNFPFFSTAVERDGARGSSALQRGHEAYWQWKRWI